MRNGDEIIFEPSYTPNKNWVKELDPRHMDSTLSSFAAPKNDNRIITFAEATDPSSTYYGYESLGLEGLKQLKLTIEYIKKISDDVIIIGDAKRGDIDSTSAAYANSLFNYWEVDIATVNPYMGRDSILPFLEYKNRVNL